MQEGMSAFLEMQAKIFREMTRGTHMPVQIAMPNGLTMTEGLITEWKFKEGDSVKKGDVLFTLETEGSL